MAWLSRSTAPASTDVQQQQQQRQQQQQQQRDSSRYNLFLSRPIVLFFTLLCLASMVFGFGVIGLSVVGRNTVQRHSFVSNNLRSFAEDGIAAGALCVCASAIALLAYYRRSFWLLAVAAVISVALIVLQIFVAIAALEYTEALGMAKRDLGSLSATSYGDVMINNAVLSAFIKCCSGCTSGCDNPDLSTFDNYTLPNCQAPSVCVEPVPCRQPTDQDCFILHDKLYRNNNGEQQVFIPTNLIEDFICTDLASLSLAGVPLVGPASQDSCGGGSPDQFLNDVMSYFKAESTPFFAAYISVAIVQMCILFLTTGLVLSSSSAHYRFPGARVPAAKAVLLSPLGAADGIEVMDEVHSEPGDALPLPSDAESTSSAVNLV